MRWPLLAIGALLFSTAAAATANGQSSAAPASQENLAGHEPLPLTGARRAAFEAYVAEALVRFDVPGAAVAVVQDGRVV
jgi:CubicO group peptidase (beta-lactamase class C family)